VRGLLDLGGRVVGGEVIWRTWYGLVLVICVLQRVKSLHGQRFGAIRVAGVSTYPTWK
jgi:hypothetical protein